MHDDIIANSRKQHANCSSHAYAGLKGEAAEPRNPVSCPNPTLKEQYPGTFFKPFMVCCAFPGCPDLMGRLIIFWATY